jgi:hypothetical protein
MSYKCICGTPKYESSTKTGSGWVCKLCGVVFADEWDSPFLPTETHDREPREVLRVKEWCTKEKFYFRGEDMMILYTGPITTAHIITESGDTIIPRYIEGNQMIAVIVCGKKYYQLDQPN